MLTSTMLTLSLLLAETESSLLKLGCCGGVLPINKDKDFTMQIGLLFPWQLLLSRAGVREEGLCLSWLQTRSPRAAFLADINGESA